MTIFHCPKCQGAFSLDSRTYRCENGHTYDRSSGGYVNLLPHGGKQHGDDRGMLLARRSFLESGGYAPLQKALSEAVLSLALPERPIILDAGCGEGYYTAAIRSALPTSDIYGIDISKDAVKMCDNRRMNASFAAASVYDLPVRCSSTDLVISVFSPFAREEFLRVLKDGGYLISVIPAERHLWQLKSVLYETPYENKLSPYEVQDFTFLGMRPVSFVLDLKTNEEILSLYGMTPYCYRTGRWGRERIEALSELSTEIAFQILIYQKTA